MFRGKTLLNCFAAFLGSSLCDWVRGVVDLVKGRTNNCFRRSSGERYDWTSDRTSPDDKSRVFLRERAESVRDDLDASERGIEK